MVGLEQMPEAQDGRLVGQLRDPRIEARELAIQRHIVQRFFQPTATRFMSSRNSRLRMRFGDSSNALPLKPICFIVITV